MENDKFTSNDSLPYRKRKLAWIFPAMIIFAVVVVFIFFKAGTVKNAIDAIISVFTPVFYGIAIAYILNPVVVFFKRLYSLVAVKVFKVKSDAYKKQAGVFAIILAIALLLFALWILLSLILPQLFQTIITLVEYIPNEFDEITKWLSQYVDPDKQWTVWLDTITKSLLDKIEVWFTDDFQQIIKLALQYITSGVATVISAVFDIIVGICVAVYLLKDKNQIFAHMRKITFALFGQKRSKVILDIGIHAKNIFNGYVYGTLLGSLIVFVATLVFMLITNMPYAILISTIVCITNIIPFFGPFIGAIPSIFILLLYNPATAVLFTIFTLIIQQVEGHFLTPLLISGTTGVSPFWVTTALLVGGGFFGLSGLLFSVPIFSVIYYLVKLFIENKLKLKSMPVETSSYENQNDFDYSKITNAFKSKRHSKKQ